MDQDESGYGIEEKAVAHLPQEAGGFK